MARKLSPGIHNIRIKKPGGGTRMQRVKVLKSGKFKFIKNVKGGAKPKAKKAAAKPGGKAKGTSPKKQGGKPRMARRKSSLPNRIINFGLLMLALATPLRIVFERLGDTKEMVNQLLFHATAGLARTDGVPGKFDTTVAATMYGPVAASFILFEVKKMAMKKFRF